MNKPLLTPTMVDNELTEIDKVFPYSIKENHGFRSGVRFARDFYEERLKVAIEALEAICKTDLAKESPDAGWLVRWRNDTKQFAQEALKKIRGGG